MTNPVAGIITESKRLPLVWDDLFCSTVAWRRLLPQTRDPRHAPWRGDAGWLLKGAYCNNGDQVCIRRTCTRREWLRVCLDVSIRPWRWVAQRRFDVTPIESPQGPLMPCLGVYVIDGRAAGVYARLTRKAIVDHGAMDVAVLLEGEE